jgi:hypothetical protein
MMNAELKEDPKSSSSFFSFSIAAFRIHHLLSLVYTAPLPVQEKSSSVARPKRERALSGVYQSSKFLRRRDEQTKDQGGDHGSFSRRAGDRRV